MNVRPLVPRLVVGVAVVASAGLVTEACLQPTQVTLVLQTDVPCAEILGVSVTVGSGDDTETKPSSTVATSCDGNGKVGSVVLVPSGTDRTSPFSVKVVAGRNVDVDQCVAPSYGKGLPSDPKSPKNVGCIVARRSLRFIEHEPLTLVVDLRGACVGEACTPGNTCVTGSCVSSQMDDPSVCAQPEGCSEAYLGGGGEPPSPDAGEDAGDASDASDADADAAPEPIGTPVGIAAGIEGRDQGNEGLGHSCAVFDSGRMLCWGDNTYGQLGDGTTTSSAMPVEVKLGANMPQKAKAIAAGQFFTCALFEGGSVYCWGRNNVGQLGLGTTDQDPHPTPKSAVVSNAASIAGGSAHACAITDPGGDLVCWGENLTGQISQGGMATLPTATLALSGQPTKVTAVAPGMSHTCALRGGNLFCWGTGPAAATMPSTSMPVIGATGSLLSTTAGTGHTCYISSQKIASCFGANGSFQLGRETMETAVPGATSASNVGSFDGAIAAGDDFTCANFIASDASTNALSCWGDDTFGQLGWGTQNSSALGPVLGLPTAGVTGFSTGGKHSCAIGIDGAVYCWGCGASGQLGDGTTGATCADRSTKSTGAVKVLGLAP